MEFEATTYSVYARADKNNKVTKVFSNCFEQPKETDILIKSGHGDEYVHAQGQYQIYNDDGTHKYCMDNGAMRECTLEELKAERVTFPVSEPTKEERIATLEECCTELLYQNALQELGITEEDL